MVRRSACVPAAAGNCWGPDLHAVKRETVTGLRNGAVLEPVKRAMVAEALANLPKHIHRTDRPNGLSQAEAASLLNVSPRSVQRAAEVKREAPAVPTSWKGTPVDRCTSCGFYFVGLRRFRGRLTCTACYRKITAAES